MKNVIEYMMQANKDSDEEVALEACEFWYVFLFTFFCVHVPHMLFQFPLFLVIFFYW